MNYIKTFQREHVRMPTRKEIMYHCKIGRGPLQRIIFSLRDQGRLERVELGIAYRVKK